MRIVSLLPSATEILFAIGAADDVVGVTFECDFPAEARRRRIVSNTALTHGLTPAQIDEEVKARLAAGEDLYRLDEGALRDLAPDIIVTQDLCAVCAVDVANVDKAMEHLGCRAQVITTDPMTLDEVFDSIIALGTATGNADAALVLTARLRARLQVTAAKVSGRDRPRVVLLEWTDPPFSAGHWVPDMVEAAGASCVLGSAGDLSRQVSWSDVSDARPDIVVVAPCGYRLDGAADLAASVQAAGVLPDNTAVWAVDADAAFVRPGPRLVEGVEALAGIVHPSAVPLRGDLARRVHSG